MSDLIKLDDLATKLVRHFKVDDDQALGKKSLLTIKSFIDTDSSWERNLDFGYLLHVVSQLVHHGFLVNLGGIGENQILFGRNFSETNAEYGLYENRVGGPVEIFKRHSKAVVPVIVKDSQGDPAIGTGFLIGNANTLITARHVIENKKEIKFSGDGTTVCTVLDISVHENPKVDLAILLVHNEDWCDIKPFRRSQHQLGEDVLSIGFPPIPRFDSLRVLEHGEVASEIKTMNGQVVSTGLDYIESVEYFLINARVKGGSSGAPVINRDGFVVGVVANSALNTSSSNGLEGLGYGVVTPSQRFMEMLDPSSKLEKLQFTINSEGYASTYF
jgi:serine protease Do